MPFDVQPAPGAEPAESPAAGTPDLSKIPLEDPSYDPNSDPVIGPVANADIPGVILTESDLTRPELAGLAKNGRAIFEKTPVSLYRGKSGIVFFNEGVVKEDEVRKLDAAGQLERVFVPLDEVLSGGASPEAGTPDPGSLPAIGGVPSPSAGAQTKMAGARARATTQPNLPPTRQPVPGGGSLLNQFVRSPV